MKTHRSLQCLQPAPLINRSGFDVFSHPSILPIREGYFEKVNWTIVGEAPKDFLRIYEYGAVHKTRSAHWPAYIAKVGQKWYPNESVTEHLLTRLGQSLGLEIADSRLMWVRGQLRFLSRYFLKPDESLVHGAEIFAGHLADMNFVQEVEAQKQSRNVFTYQVVEEAIRSRFPKEEKPIMESFVRLLAFDAIVGNNDRHYYNWGVITQVSGKRPPQLSPIYDTARALFWNSTEARLQQVENEKRWDVFLRKYIGDSQPKTGWDESPDINHFGLMRKISAQRPEMRPTLLAFPVDTLPEKAGQLLEGEFAGLLSERRMKFVLSCLRGRIQEFKKSISNHVC